MKSTLLLCGLLLAPYSLMCSCGQATNSAAAASTSRTYTPAPRKTLAQRLFDMHRPQPYPTPGQARRTS